MIPFSFILYVLCVCIKQYTKKASTTKVVDTFLFIFNSYFPLVENNPYLKHAAENHKACEVLQKARVD